jgi:hypothetical protein
MIPKHSFALVADLLGETRGLEEGKPVFGPGVDAFDVPKTPITISSVQYKAYSA